MEGKVKWFSDTKGFGFITGEDGEYFVHHSHIVMPGYRKLLEGQTVRFEVRNGDKGLAAHNVEVVL